MDWLQRLYHHILRQADYLGPQHWVLILVGIILLGVFLLRGFGSLAKY
jgi:hypothetical protein